MKTSHSGSNDDFEMNNLENFQHESNQRKLGIENDPTLPREKDDHFFEEMEFKNEEEFSKFLKEYKNREKGIIVDTMNDENTDSPSSSLSIGKSDNGELSKFVVESPVGAGNKYKRMRRLSHIGRRGNEKRYLKEDESKSNTSNFLKQFENQENSILNNSLTSDVSMYSYKNENDEDTETETETENDIKISTPMKSLEFKKRRNEKIAQELSKSILVEGNLESEDLSSSRTHTENEENEENEENLKSIKDDIVTEDKSEVFEMEEEEKEKENILKQITNQQKNEKKKEKQLSPKELTTEKIFKEFIEEGRELLELEENEIKPFDDKEENVLNYMDKLCEIQSNAFFSSISIELQGKLNIIDPSSENRRKKTKEKGKGNETNEKEYRNFEKSKFARINRNYSAKQKRVKFLHDDLGQIKKSMARLNASHIEKGKVKS